VPPLKTGIITTICKIEVYIENFRTRHSSVGNCFAISSSAALEKSVFRSGNCYAGLRYSWVRMLRYCCVARLCDCCFDGCVIVVMQGCVIVLLRARLHDCCVARLQGCVIAQC
jgi:hypothetical protein